MVFHQPKTPFEIIKRPADLEIEIIWCFYTFLLNFICIACVGYLLLNFEIQNWPLFEGGGQFGWVQSTIRHLAILRTMVHHIAKLSEIEGCGENGGGVFCAVGKVKQQVGLRDDCFCNWSPGPSNRSLWQRASWSTSNHYLLDWSPWSCSQQTYLVADDPALLKDGESVELVLSINDVGVDVWVWKFLDSFSFRDFPTKNITEKWSVAGNT